MSYGLITTCLMSLIVPEDVNWKFQIKRRNYCLWLRHAKTKFTSQATQLGC